MSTPPSSAQGNRIEAPPRGVGLAIAASVFVTVIAALVVWWARQDPMVRGILPNRYALVDGDRAAAAAMQLAIAASQRSDLELATLSKQAAIENGPTDLVRITGTLIRLPDNLPANTLGVYLAEEGAKRYKSTSLLIRAGVAYAQGQAILKDYRKATHYLSDPTLAATPAAAFHLAEVLLAADNPGRDDERGMSLMRQAAQDGYPEAIQRLSRMQEFR